MAQISQASQNQMSIHVQTQVDVDNSGDESDVRPLLSLPLTLADLIPLVLDVFPKKDGQRLRPQYGLRAVRCRVSWVCISLLLAYKTVFRAVKRPEWSVLIYPTNSVI